MSDEIRSESRLVREDVRSKEARPINSANKSSTSSASEGAATKLELKDMENSSKVEKLRNLYKESLAKSGSFQPHRKSFDSKQESNEAADRRDYKETLKARVESMQNSYNEKIEESNRDRAQSISSKENELKEVKRHYEKLIAEEKQRHETEMNRIRSVWRGNLEKDREQFGALISDKDEQFQEARLGMQKKYSDATADKQSQLQEAHNKLVNNVQDRLDNQVRKTQYDNDTLRLQNTLQKNSSERRHNLEKKHLIDSYEDKLKLSADAGEQQRELFKEEMKERVASLSGRSSEALNKTAEFYKNELRLLKSQHRQQEDIERRNQLSQLNKMTQQHEKQLKAIMNDNNKNRTIEEEYMKNVINNTKEYYQANLIEDRERQQQSIQSVFKTSEEKLKNIQENYDKKTDTNVNKYQAEIQQLKFDKEKELSRMNKYFQEQLKNKDKFIALEKESVGTKYEKKIALIEEAHQRDMENLNKKHQEQLTDLAKRMSSNRKLG